MLDTLDQIDWRALSHAYGEADDVPELLRKLAWGDEQTRQDALYSLYGNIYHQGTVYQATAYAVPFLIEMLQSEAVAGRDKILVLLVHLASGHSYWAVHQHLSIFDDIYPGRKESPEFKAEIAKELDWVKAAYLAVRKGTPVYLQLLEHADADLRMAAAYVLSLFGGRSAFTNIMPVPRSRLATEEDAQVRASVIYSLSYLAPPLEMVKMVDPDLRNDVADYIRLFTHLLDARHESDLVHVLAAIALLRVAADDAPARAVERLVATLADGAGTVATLYNGLPWADEGVAAEIGSCLCRLQQSAITSAIITALVTALETTDGLTALSVSATLLHLSFGRADGRVAATNDDPVQPGRLTIEQRDVLASLAKDDNPCWEFNGNMSIMLRSYGLPNEPDAVRAFLASAH